MNPSKLAVKKVNWRVTGVMLMAVTIGTGIAGAETFSSGGSTTTIEQSGGRGPSHSQVIRDPEGQTIITQDGNSTDITVQRHAGAPSADETGELPPTGADRFDQSRIKQRFSRRAPARGSAGHCPVSGSFSLREAFKQRMLERLHRSAP